MPLHIVRHDITLMPVDAIVSPGNERLAPNGGVSGAILARGGPALLEACQRLSSVRTGEAKLTRGFLLPCRYVIHTAGPIWRGGDRGEEELLRACYRSCLALAADRHVQSLAIPVISSGAYGYPMEGAIAVAVQEIRAFLRSLPEREDMTISLVLYSDEAVHLGSVLHQEVTAYIDAAYVAAHSDGRMRRTQYRQVIEEDEADFGEPMQCVAALPEDESCQLPKAPQRPEAAKKRASLFARPARAFGRAQQDELHRQLQQVEETFSQQLMRLIDERGMKDSECYKRANIDRKLFSKIRSRADYAPSKPTAVAFAVSLGLTLAETRELLGKAGYALNRANKFDIIVEFFISRGIYDVDLINMELFEENMPRLGS